MKYFYSSKDENYYQDVLCTGEGEWHGGYDCAYTGDTNGDGKPEFVLGLGAGSGHFVVPYAFHLVDGKFSLVWQAEEPSENGYVFLSDIDGDDIYEIVINSSARRFEYDILEGPVRENICWKWDQKEYYPRYCGCLRPEEEALSTAASFLYNIWLRNYDQAMYYAYLPCFLGIEGLADAGLNSLQDYAEKELQPLIDRNLQGGKLKTEYDFSVYGGLLSGIQDSFYIEVLKVDNEFKVVRVNCFPRYEAPEEIVKRFVGHLNWGEPEKARELCQKGLDFMDIYTKYREYPYSEDQLYIETFQQDESRAAVLSYYANLSPYTYEEPNRVLKLILEYKDNKWLIAAALDLDTKLPVKILHRSFKDQFGVKDDSIYTEYPVYFLKPEKIEHILIFMFERGREQVILETDFAEMEFFDLESELLLHLYHEEEGVPIQLRYYGIRTVKIEQESGCYFLSLRKV